jgi:hypothetical protein
MVVLYHHESTVSQRIAFPQPQTDVAQAHLHVASVGMHMQVIRRNASGLRLHGFGLGGTPTLKGIDHVTWVVASRHASSMKQSEWSPIDCQMFVSCCLDSNNIA